MPLIKPISDLRNKTMSHYSKLQKQLELYSKLAVAQSQKAAGEQGRTLAEVMKDIHRIIHGARDYLTLFQYRR